MWRGRLSASNTHIDGVPVPCRRIARSAVILVEYHSGGLVADRAFEALDAGHDVVVADNTGAYRGPGSVVSTGGNVGFGAACNAAVATLAPEVDVIVLQNPDASVDQADLSSMVTLIRDGGWAALAPALRTDRVRSYGFAVPGPLRELALVAMDCVGTLGIRASAWRQAASADEDGAASDPVVRDGRFGSAAFLVVDRAAFDAVGGFDERYFLYVEDLDLWMRLRAYDRVGFVPAVVVDHRSSTGSEGSSTRRTLLRWLGRELYAQEHNGAWPWTRALHRVGLLCLNPGADPVTAVVAAGMRSRRPPDALQREVRDFVTSTPRGRRSSVAHVRGGWSRTRIPVRPRDLVLDVGSGAFPNPRADVLCERSLVRDHRIAVTDRPTVVADAEALPFRANAFDLVIASHIAEHVPHPDLLCRELTRVAARTYMETPSPIFERLFPAENHRWIVRKTGARRLVFEPNLRPSDLWLRLGDRLRPWYYAGTDAGRPTPAGASFPWSLIGRLAYVVRGTLNRSGLTVTRLHVDGPDGIDARVLGENQAAPVGRSDDD